MAQGKGKSRKAFSSKSLTDLQQLIDDFAVNMRRIERKLRLQYKKLRILHKQFVDSKVSLTYEQNQFCEKSADPALKTDSAKIELFVIND